LENRATVTASDSLTSVTKQGSDSNFVAPFLVRISLVKDQIIPLAAIGESVTYQIVVTNTGMATLTDVAIVDTISPVVTGAATEQPAGFGAPVVSQVAGGTRYVWSGSGLTFYPGNSLTFTVTGTIGSLSTDTVISNTAYAWVASVCYDISKLSNGVSTTILVPSAVEAVCAASPRAISMSMVRISFTITNSGAGAIASTMVVDTLPAGFAFVSATGSYSQVGDIVVWDVGAVGPGASVTVSMMCQAPVIGATGWVVNESHATYSDGADKTAFAAPVTIDLLPELAMRVPPLPLHRPFYAGGMLVFTAVPGGSDVSVETLGGTELWKVTTAGLTTVQWNGLDSDGIALPIGTYVWKTQVGATLYQGQFEVD
jgi:uncharacterized repeat protein (TIGR01451 family)